MSLPPTAFIPYQNKVSYNEPQRPTTNPWTGQVSQEILRQPTVAGRALDVESEKWRTIAGMLGPLFRRMAGGFGGEMGGTGIPGGFNFNDLEGSKIGGVNFGFNPPAVWNQGIAGQAGKALGAAAQMPGGGMAPPGAPPTMGNVRVGLADMPVGMAQNALSGLQMAGGPMQTDMDLNTQMARANAAQGAQGLRNQALGLGAKGALQQGNLDLIQAALGRDALFNLFMGPSYASQYLGQYG